MTVTGAGSADSADRLRSVYVISVAAELTGVHPQTLRVYERKGLISPARTGGMSRRYSEADLDQIRRVLLLTSEGLNLIGVARVLKLEAEIEELRAALGARTSTALVPLSDSAGSPRDSAGSPRDSAGSPRDSAGSPRDSAGSPRDSAGSQRFSAGSAAQR